MKHRGNFTFTINIRLPSRTHVTEKTSLIELSNNDDYDELWLERDLKAL